VTTPAPWVDGCSTNARWPYNHGMDHLDARIAELAVLHEPVRRALYLYVARQPHEVSRGEAADAVGVQRKLAAFHLDKLAEDGLLEVSYRRLGGRTGPGAGRPAKLYRRSSRQYELSLPPRAYELAAELLAAVVEEGGDERTLREQARRAGEGLARGRGGGAARPGEDPLGPVAALLAEQGFEPYREGGELRLRNCPFHSLARHYPVLVCGMNRALAGGVLAGLGAAGLAARLDPRGDDCCVVIAASKTNED